MKNKYIIIVLSIILFCSCSKIYTENYFEQNYTSTWGGQYSTFSLKLENDTIFVLLPYEDNNVLFAGPMLVPILPKWIFFWVTDSTDSTFGITIRWNNQNNNVSINRIVIYGENEDTLSFSSIISNYSFDVTNKNSIIFKDINTREIKQLIIYFNQCLVNGQEIDMPELHLINTRRLRYNPVFLN